MTSNRIRCAWNHWSRRTVKRVRLITSLRIRFPREDHQLAHHIFTGQIDARIRLGQPLLPRLILIDSGDTILGLSGIFSGTLSWLFLQFDGTVPFTEIRFDVIARFPREDHQLAHHIFTGQIDARIRLGQPRKLVILAREAGYDIEPDQVRVESLVPAHCEEGSVSRAASRRCSICSFSSSPFSKK
jgi:hypothetical protein